MAIEVLESNEAYAKWINECDVCHSVQEYESDFNVCVSHIASIVRKETSSGFLCRQCFNKKINKIVLYDLY